jgi:adenylate kinase
MKVVLCTGISGSERIECLRDISAYAKGRGKEIETINMWEVLKKVSGQEIDEATILNLPEHIRMPMLERAFQETAISLEQKRRTEKDGQKCVVIAAHACFHWKTDYLKAFSDHLLDQIRPDILITIIHNIRDIKTNLDTNSNRRFVGITETDIIYWQKREIDETKNWARHLNKKQFAIPRNEPVDTLYKVIFEENRKAIYFSYPMSFVSGKEIKKAVELINKLRKMGFVVFDPASIDDVKYVDRLLKNNPQSSLYKDLANNVDDQTVKLDYILIEQSHIVVSRYPAVKLPGYKSHSDGMYIPLSAGVICEMVHGFNNGKRVYAVWLPKTEPSPFFAFHCREWFRSEKELLEYLSQNEL